ADSGATYDDYLHRVRKITTYAHEHGVGVEAEIDELPCGLDNDVRDADTAATDPELAARFVEHTDVDLLAVSVGNVHIKIEGEQGLDLDRLDRIRKRVAVPLVLHGGTGIRADTLREAVTMGVAKVNYGTYLKQRYLARVRAAIGKDQINPHRLLGMGGGEDVMVIGRRAVRDAVLERIHLLGCCGRG
ncbi:MAG: class II fructose-bisphosphate aldolase, partial [Pirellulales bacterium]